ncbi:hypothetical protein CW304_02540 [Bacillus sp. UFRGS-B20]|nr:hypothetical protein CW304_02540 [Bacillus sp. UFRGS-B20]
MLSNGSLDVLIDTLEIYYHINKRFHKFEKRVFLLFVATEESTSFLSIYMKMVTKFFCLNWQIPLIQALFRCIKLPD